MVNSGMTELSCLSIHKTWPKCQTRIKGFKGPKEPTLSGQTWQLPSQTYDSTVCWPRLRYKVSSMELIKLHRLASLAITGTMKIAPTAEMEVLLGLPPLNLMTEVEAQVGTRTLMRSQQ